MADEFAIGGIFATVAGFSWLVFGGLYKTPTFEEQLGSVVEHPAPLGIPTDVGIFLADLSMALMLLGPLVWWVVVPLAKWAVVKNRRAKKAD